MVIQWTEENDTFVADGTTNFQHQTLNINNKNS